MINGFQLKKLFMKPNSGVSYHSLLNFRKYRDFENGIIVGNDGTLMAAFSYRGHDVDSASETQLNFVSRRINDVLAVLGNGWAMWTDVMRVPVHSYPAAEDCHFPDPISRLIDEERRTAVMEQQDHYQSVLWVVLCYKLPSAAARRVVEAMIDDDEKSLDHLDQEQKTLYFFKRSLDLFAVNMAGIFPDFTQAKPYKEGNSWYCDFLRYLNFCATGINRPVLVPSPTFPISRLIGGQDFHCLFQPVVGKMRIAVLSIEGMPNMSEPAMLAFLEHLPISYRWNSRFIFMETHSALEELGKSRRKWNQKIVGFRDQLTNNPNPIINLDAKHMRDDADMFISEIQSGEIAAGYYTGTIVIYSQTDDGLEEITEKIQQIVLQAGMGCRLEGINSTEAFLGSIPGNVYPNITRPIISTFNLAHLMPVSSQWPGLEHCPNPMFPPESPCLIQGETVGSTPFRVNIHYSDIGHTFVAGPTGTGKSTLLGLIAAQFLKYPGAQIFAFDKGYSMMPLTYGVGGHHFDVGAEDGEQVTFKPLTNVDTAAGRAWAAEWIEMCLLLQGVSMDPKKRQAIGEALRLMKESPIEQRTLSEFFTNVQDTEVRDGIEFYTIDREAGHILDEESDSTVFTNFNCFETEHLMGLGDKIVLPTLHYIFHRIAQSLDGSPTLIFLDEVWLLFKHPKFLAMIIEWLKVLRKGNAAVVMATQSISDASRSGVMDVIMESCQTKILLPHHSVAEKTHRDFYAEMLGLNDREILLLANGIPKREYYFTNPDGKRLFQLNLRPKTLAWIGRTGKEDLNMFRKIKKANPENWREKWIDYCCAG
ncbi:MAG: conjugal transfer protein TrbE [Gammaproteobacteria bacterium]|nr:conjugal transfer protein TrbE [Gammaproteobacteria bacterium]